MNDRISAIGFFKYAKGFVGYRIYVYIVLNFIIGLFDGIGLAMFIPLIAVATGTKLDNEETLGKLQFLVDAIQSVGLEMNLLTVLLLMNILFIFKGIFYYIKNNYLNKILLIALSDIRLKLVKGLEKLSYEGYTKLDAGNLQNNMVGETAKIVSAVNSYFVTVQHVVMVLTYVSIAVMANWKFAIMVSIGGLATNFLYKYINKITKAYAKQLSKLGHNFNGKLIQTVQNFKYLRATNQFKIFNQKLREDIEKSEDISYRAGKISTIAESLREPMIIFIIALVLYIQVVVLKNNFNSIMMSLLLFYRALAHLISMQGSWNTFIKSSAGIESVEELLENFDLLKENRNLNNPIKNIGDIQLRNVSITYGNKKVLDNINLEIPNKTSIALVGESGAGKTTLANVICGLIPPHSGKVMASGLSVYDSDLLSYREKIGYITQEPVIFDDTIFNNITLWKEKSPENLHKFQEVINMVALGKFYRELELKENTPLGNNGILVSGGQKQRISIARELFKDMELLILDEATSALDSETEMYIKESIDLIQGNSTLLIVAHRLSTIKDVDKILVMEDGKVVAEGSYDELLQNSPKFRKMVELQELS